MVPDVRFAGPAFTVLAHDDHLPVFSALAEAQPGDVLVIATDGGTLAVFGELFATEAKRRGLAASSPTATAATSPGCARSACPPTRAGRSRARARRSRARR